MTRWTLLAIGLALAPDRLVAQCAPDPAAVFSDALVALIEAEDLDEAASAGRELYRYLRGPDVAHLFRRAERGAAEDGTDVTATSHALILAFLMADAAVDRNEDRLEVFRVLPELDRARRTLSALQADRLETEPCDNPDAPDSVASPDDPAAPEGPPPTPEETAVDPVTSEPATSPNPAPQAIEPARDTADPAVSTGDEADDGSPPRPPPLEGEATGAPTDRVSQDAVPAPNPPGAEDTVQAPGAPAPTPSGRGSPSDPLNLSLGSALTASRPLSNIPPDAPVRQPDPAAAAPREDPRAVTPPPSPPSRHASAPRPSDPTAPPPRAQATRAPPPSTFDRAPAPVFRTDIAQPDPGTAGEAGDRVAVPTDGAGRSGGPGSRSDAPERDRGARAFDWRLLKTVFITVLAIAGIAGIAFLIRHQSMREARRRAPRYTCNIDTRIRPPHARTGPRAMAAETDVAATEVEADQSEHPVTLEDISLYGTKINLQGAAIERDASVELLLGEHWRLARVVWCNARFAGVEFTTPLALDALNEILAATRRTGRRGPARKSRTAPAGAV